MPTEFPNYTITAEVMDFRSLGVLYEETNRKLSILFEMSAWTKGSWIATTDFDCWCNGELVQDSEKRLVFERLNEWGRARGWRFEEGVRLLDVMSFPR